MCEIESNDHWTAVSRLPDGSEVTVVGVGATPAVVAWLQTFQTRMSAAGYSTSIAVRREFEVTL